MERFSLIPLAIASSTAFLLRSSALSFDSDTELYIMALAALTCSVVTSPSGSPSAMLAARSRSSMAILASPYSEAWSAMSSRASSVILPGNRASSALDETISRSSGPEYLLNLTVFVLRNVEREASSRRLSRGSWDIMISDTGAARSPPPRVSW